MTVDELLKNKTISKQKIANNSEGIKKDFIETILACRKKIREKYDAHDLEDLTEGLKGWEDDEIYDLATMIGAKQGVEMAYMVVFGGQAFTDLMVTIFNSESEDDE